MEEASFFTRPIVRWFIGTIFVIVVAIAVYLTFYTAPVCGTYDCFKIHMTECSKVTYVSEQPEASWGYSVVAKQDTSCQIEVTLLQAKKGDLGIDKLNGETMICSYPVGVSAYPEKNLDVCSGRLKEDLQSLLIKKLYSYILDNLGQFNKSLNSVI